jgi:uncharacterized membrane-anchored protein YhcB (DUF1043 family)
LFGKIAGINSGGTNADITTILTNTGTIISRIGTVDDTSTEDTVFGDLFEIQDFVDSVETLIGSSTDAVDTSLFGSLSSLSSIQTDLTTIQEAVDKAKSSASSALSEAAALRDELGAEGKTPNTYSKIEKLDEALAQLRTAAEAISESQVESEQLTTEILTTLGNFVNESAKAVGLGGTGVEVEGLGSGEMSDQSKVQQKLDEINAKLNAIKDAIETEDVVVKTWFASGE